jgi:hypothetical protein
MSTTATAPRRPEQLAASLRGPALYEALCARGLVEPTLPLTAHVEELLTRLPPSGPQIVRFCSQQAFYWKYDRATHNASPVAFAAQYWNAPFPTTTGRHRGSEGFSLKSLYNQSVAAIATQTPESESEAPDALLAQLLWIGTAGSRRGSNESFHALELSPQVEELLTSVGLPRVTNVVSRYWLKADAVAFLAPREAQAHLGQVEPGVLEELGLISGGSSGGVTYLREAMHSLAYFLSVLCDGETPRSYHELSIMKIVDGRGKDPAPNELELAVVSLFKWLVAKALSKGSGDGVAASLVQRLANGIQLLHGGPEAVGVARQLVGTHPSTSLPSIS